MSYSNSIGLLSGVMAIALATAVAPPCRAQAKGEEDEAKSQAEKAASEKDAGDDKSRLVEGDATKEKKDLDGEKDSGGSNDSDISNRPPDNAPQELSDCDSSQPACAAEEAIAGLVKAIAAVESAIGDENLVAKLEALENRAASAVLAMRNLQVAVDLSPSVALDALLAQLRAKVLEVKVDKAMSAEAKAERAKEALKLGQGIVDSLPAQKANAEKKKDAEQEKLAAEAERLMKYGVTFGVAATVHIPLKYDNQRLARLDAPKAGAMPYLLFMPAFWFGNAANRTYCAAKWSASDAATEAAAEEAQKRDEKIIKDRIARLTQEKNAVEASMAKATQDVEALRRSIGEFNEDVAPEDRITASDQGEIDEQLKKVKEAITEAQRLAEGSKSKDEADKFKAQLKLLQRKSAALHSAKQVEPAAALKQKLQELEVRIREEQTTLRGLQVNGYDRECGWYKWAGFYVGYPGMFDGTTTLPQGTLEDTRDRELDPILSFGYAAAPNAMVSGLVGASVGTVDRDGGTDATFWVMTVGLGGNADLISLIQ